MIELSNYSNFEDSRSMMISIPIKVKELYFEYKELTPLHGKTTFDTLYVVLPAVRRTTHKLVRCMDRPRMLHAEHISLFTKIVDYKFISYSF